MESKIKSKVHRTSLVVKHPPCNVRDPVSIPCEELRFPMSWGT